MAATEHPHSSNSANLIYLDHAATTPVDARVLDRMLPYFTEHYGNPSSVHEPGREARAALDWARGTVTRILNCGPREIVFTSGATEANNLAIKGLAMAALQRWEGRQPHIITSAIEHPAVLQTVQELVHFGVRSTIVPVNSAGLLDPYDVGAALEPETCLVSIMYANNEIGTVQPIAEISAKTRSAGVPLHVDAVQAAGKLPLDVAELGIDLLSLSAHKLNGPKGSGLLFVRAGVRPFPQLHGGGQEYARRAGTENVAGAVGLAAALELAVHEQTANTLRMAFLRDRLANELMERIPAAQLNGDWRKRLSNNVHISFDDVDGESLLFHLDLRGLAASSGSACASGSGKPSHVLIAIGLTVAQAEGSLRLTLGPSTTEEEIDRAVEVIVASVEQIRAFSAANLS